MAHASWLDDLTDEQLRAIERVVATNPGALAQVREVLDGRELVLPAHELLCCGTWIAYPTAGHESVCPVCGSTFAV